MCTAITFNTECSYFGRNLDYEFSYNESIAITPRSYPFIFRHEEPIMSHYAIIGTAVVENGYPLYYEAANEMGLGIAGLNFPGLAYYFDEQIGKRNIAPYEFIPWILSQYKNVDEVEYALKEINLINTPYSSSYPLSPLHWMISDKQKSITVESMQNGLHIHKNPIGVLTNNPPFDLQMFALNNYGNLSCLYKGKEFCDALPINEYSRGMGGLGLPGDLSSMSRFVRAAFTKLYSKCPSDEDSSVSQFFHILRSVEQSRGCTEVKSNSYEYTIYTSCINLDKGIYYYTTYDNSQITAIDMHRENLNEFSVITYPMLKKGTIRNQN